MNIIKILLFFLTDKLNEEDEKVLNQKYKTQLAFFKKYKIIIFIFFGIIVAAFFLTNRKFYEPPVPGTFTDPRDGHVYKTVTLGNKVWLSENMAYKLEGGNCMVLSDSLYFDKFGFFYDWETANNIAPEGWRLPTKKEYNELISQFGVYGLLKSGFPKLEEYASQNNQTCGTSHFDVIMTGYYLSGSDSYFSVEEATGFWTATEEEVAGIITANICSFEFRTFKSVYVSPARTKKDGCYVRLIKDIEIEEK